MHLLDRQRDTVGLRPVAQLGARAEQAVDALGQHHHVGMEDGTLHVPRAGILAALELQHLQAALSQRESGGIAGHAGADDDRIESFLDHGSLL